MDFSALSGLGSSGGIGVGGSGGSSDQYQSTAKSGARGDSSFLGAFGSGAGIRGFVNNVAFPGASQTNEQGINPPLTARVPKTVWVIVAAGAVAVLFILLKKYGH